MTKKELNAIRAAAYKVFFEQHPDIYPGTYYCYRIQEGRQVKLLLLTAKTQLNSNTLRENGFSDNAEARLIFTADCATKTLTPMGRWVE